MKRRTLRTTALLLISFLIGACGGTPTAPDKDRQDMEERRDDAFRELD